MQGTLKQKYRANVRAGFIRIGRWWQASRLKQVGLALWRLVRGSGHFFFGASLRRTLLEVIGIGLVIFWLAGGEPPMVVDYRLLAIQFLPGAIVTTIWASLRLRKVSPGLGWRAAFGRLVLTPLNGLLLTGVVTLLAFGLALLQYPLTELAVPVVPNLFDNPSRPQIGRLADIVSPVLSWPGQFDPTTSPLLIVLVRLLVYTGELSGLFVIGRLVAGLFALPGRWLDRLNQRRLLWRLTFSHFWVVLLSFLAAGLTLVGLALAFGPNRNEPTRQQVPARAAQRVADTLQLENRSQPLTADETTAFLRQLTFNLVEPGDFNLTPLNPSQRTKDMVRETPDPSDISNFPQVQFIVVTDLDGKVTASSSPVRFPVGKGFLETSVARLAPGRWAELLVRARNGETDLSRLSSTQAGPPLLIAGAYPLPDRSGQPNQIVLVAERPEVAVLYSSQGLLGLLGISAVFLFSMIMLSFTTMLVALLFGYFSSRRLVRGLERLASAADALAIGQLDQRVPLDGQDEVNRLATRFNLMAYRLEQSQANLAQEKGKAEQALQSKRELVANVSHELRTPVATIRAHIDWLLLTAERARTATSAADASQPALDQQELYNYLEIIERETGRLSALIEDLLDLSRIESQGPAVQMEVVEVAGVINEIKGALGLMAQRERKIKLTLDLSPDLPPVWADPTRLSQVLLNLTRNAINYTPPGGIISVGAGLVSADRLAIWVADTGIGIAAAELPHIFERFYRSDSSRSRNTGGAGLGLAIVRALVEAMGGTIEVESAVGEGSKFTVFLPVSTQHVEVELPA